MPFSPLCISLGSECSPLVAWEVRQGCAGEVCREEAAGQRGQGHPRLFDGGKKPVIYVYAVIAGSPLPTFCVVFISSS